MTVQAGFVREDDLNYEAVVFLADNGETFEIQRELDPTDDLGNYCVASNTGATVYEGVQSWDASATRIRFTLTPVAADEMGLEPQVDLNLDERSAVEEVVAHLRRIIGSNG